MKYFSMHAVEDFRHHRRRRDRHLPQNRCFEKQPTPRPRQPRPLLLLPPLKPSRFAISIYQ
jgi:hypothetical protein